MPHVKCGPSDDNFGAVRFDCCGEMLDIVISSLTITDEKYLREQERERTEWLKSLKRAQDVELRLGPAGGLRSLSFRIDDSFKSVCDRAKADECLQVFKRHKIPVRELREPRTPRRRT